MFVTFSVVLLLFLGTSCVAAQRQCNGFAQLCDRSLGNITFIGAHDSFAYDSGSTGSTVGVGISSTQYNNVSQQLTDGVRMLQGQGHRLENSGDSEVYLCHTSCALLNGGTLTDYLKKVVTFLDDNPNEVIILLWVNTVGDRLPVSDYGDSYKASGLDKYSYIPSETPVRIDAWPTLGQLISEGKRAITFMDKGADLDSVPYILDEYSMIFETVPNPQNNNFPCQMRNSSGGDSPDGRMYLVNHNLNRKVSSSIVVPDVGKVNTTNAACGEHTIGQQVDNCVALYDRNPNIIMLDYYNYPAKDPFEVADYLNGVGPNPCDSDAQTSNTLSSGSSPTTTSAGAGSSAAASATSSGAATVTTLASGAGNVALANVLLVLMAIALARST